MSKIALTDKFTFGIYAAFLSEFQLFGLFLDGKDKPAKIKTKETRHEQITKQDPNKQKVYDGSFEKIRQKTFQLRDTRPEDTTKRDPKTELKSMFGAVIAPNNTRIARKTTFLFTSRNQNNKHNPTHKNITKQEKQNEQNKR